MSTTTTKIVTLVDGTTFELPYADLLPPLPDDEFRALVEDIRENGIVVPIHVNRSNEVVDGQHRLLAAKELGLRVNQIPIDLCLLDDLAAERRRALTLNLHRRQLSREVRERLVREFRSEGLSYRAIADEIGVSEATVRRIDKCSTASNDAVEQPTHVTGADGKERPAESLTAAQIAERRRTVSELAAEGVPMRDIAERLGVSVGTVSGDFRAAVEALAKAEEQRAEEEAEEAQRQEWARQREQRDAEWAERRAQLDAERAAEEAERLRLREELGLRHVKTSDDTWDVLDVAGDRRGRIERSTEDPRLLCAYVTLEDEGRPVEFQVWAWSHNGVGGHSTFKSAIAGMEKAIADPGNAKRIALQNGKFATPEDALATGASDDGEADEEVGSRAHPFHDLNLAKDAWKWEHRDLITGTLWHLGARAQGEGRDGSYHGNFVPQIPDQVLRRYTKLGDVVVDLFLGGGTTMVEAVRLGRACIGVDLQEDVVTKAWSLLERLPNPLGVEVMLEAMDSTEEQTYSWVRRQLHLMGRDHADHIILHPPYHSIIEFSEDERDLSRAPSVDKFLSRWSTVSACSAALLAPGRFLTLVIGDVVIDGEAYPLGFECMRSLREVGLKLVATNVKDIQGNIASERNSGLWTYRALKSGIQIFKHEYVFIFRRP